MYNNPFLNITLGLQHGSYNTPARDYRPIGDAREIETVDRNPYKYKYQGQERQDELNLNWDSFKWRNYDYAIGRFMSVDPLAEKYSYQSPYNFSENRVVDGIELEGLEHLDGKIVHQFKYNTLVDGKNIYSTRGASETGIDNIYSRTSTELNNNTVYNDTTVSVNEDGVISSVTTHIWDSNGDVNYANTVTEPEKVENAVSNLGNTELENGQTLKGYVQDLAGYKVSNGESPIQTEANKNKENGNTAARAGQIATYGGIVTVIGNGLSKTPNPWVSAAGVVTTIGGGAAQVYADSLPTDNPEEIEKSLDIK